jgi:hypothetical protein
MTARPVAGGIAAAACRIAVALVVFLSLVAPAAMAEMPARWQVRADDWSGTLELRVDPSGRVSGTLEGRTVTGFLAGRRIVLHRALEDRTEVWDGWLPENVGSPGAFLAGGVTVNGRVLPWYALPEAGAPAAQSADRGVAPAPAPVPATPADRPPPASASSGPGLVPAPGATVAPTALPADPGWGAWNLSGTWTTAAGRADVSQKGKTLLVVLADGTGHSGRFTATDTIVVGLRKGCCKGKIKGPGVIEWSDGAVWKRAR